MRFSSNLTEATLLKRSIKFLAEVVLTNGQKLMIRCPTLNPIIGCDILGTKLWYSNAIGYHCLPTWEMVEVDGGHLVSINPELLKPLVIEAVKKGNIPEFLSYNVLHAGSSYEHSMQQGLLLEAGSAKCYVCLEHLTLATEAGEGLFPERQGIGVSNLQRLIELRRAGHRAILFFCAMHTGVRHIKPAYHICAEYIKLLNIAVAEGVELLGYKADIAPHGIELTTKLPIVFAADEIYKELE